MGVPQVGASSLVIGPPYAPTRLRLSMQSHDVDFVSIVRHLPLPEQEQKRAGSQGH
jgi:hypothetical protein